MQPHFGLSLCDDFEMLSQHIFFIPIGTDNTGILFKLTLLSFKILIFAQNLIMYSKEEAQIIRKKFWSDFDTYSKKRRRKLGKRSSWMLQKTGIKGFSLKFDANNKSIQVGFEIASKGLQRQIKYYEKMQSLKALLDAEFNNELIWNDHYLTESGKEVFRIYCEKADLSLYNKKDWNFIFDFFFKQMNKFEDWFLEYKDIIKMNEEEIFNDE